MQELICKKMLFKKGTVATWSWRKAIIFQKQPPLVFYAKIVEKAKKYVAKLTRVRNNSWRVTCDFNLWTKPCKGQEKTIQKFLNYWQTSQITPVKQLISPRCYVTKIQGTGLTDRFWRVIYWIAFLKGDKILEKYL